MRIKSINGAPQVARKVPFRQEWTRAEKRCICICARDAGRWQARVTPCPWWCSIAARTRRAAHITHCHRPARTQWQYRKDDVPIAGPLGNLAPHSSIVAGSNAEREWVVDRILGHSGRAAEVYFRIQWKAGGVTWLPYSKVHHLNAFKEYLDLQNVSSIQSLPNLSLWAPTLCPQTILKSLSVP